MRIGRITNDANSNIGNKLQSYALQKFLYRIADEVHLFWHSGDRYIDPSADPWFDGKLILSEYGTEIVRRYKIKSFDDRYIHTVYDKEQMRDDSYDFFVVGSDQVWNYQLWISETEFLQFVPPSKRVAYAASFGVSNIPASLREQYTKMLREMKAISVREQRGAEIVKELTGRDVPVLVDPVLLLEQDEWRELAKAPLNVSLDEPYLFVYLFSGIDTKIGESLQKISQERQLRIIDGYDWKQFDQYMLGPEEFLYMIEHAALVYTDSFHVTVCSVIFHVPFVTLPNPAPGNRNSRMESLLDMFGLRYRLVPPEKIAGIPNLMQADFSQVEERLRKERKRSEEFLREVLRQEDVPFLTNELLTRRKGECYGCGACEQSCAKKAISMLPDEEGFLYPRIDEEKCIKCGSCAKVCQMLNGKRFASTGREAYACINKDMGVRISSNSGGMFRVFAESILEREGKIFGARLRDDMEGVLECAGTQELCKTFSGSKYVQCRTGNTYSMAKEFLEQGKHVLFTGTPCQIHGLRLYLGKDYENLLTVDIICHGVPSPLVFKQYISALGVKLQKQIVQVTFRQKETGWRNPVFRAVCSDGTIVKMDANSSPYMSAFLNELINRPSCAYCANKAIHYSDITIGDYWGVWGIHPEMDDDKGTSLVILRTEKGKRSFEKISDRIVMLPTDPDYAAGYNPALVRPFVPHKSRTRFFAAWKMWDYDAAKLVPLIYGALGDEQ